MRISRTVWLLWISLSGLALACQKADPGTGSAPGKADLPALREELPPPQTSHRTTSGSIALSNLNAQITSAEHLVAAGDPDGKRRRQLIDLLSMRAEFAGRIADLERAAGLAEQLPNDAPTVAESYLARAGMRSALHRFDEALEDLDEAERWGLPAQRTSGKRASIFDARGEVDEALRAQLDVVSTRSDIHTLGALAVLLGELERRDEALDAFHLALAGFDDTLPFPVAWLFFRQGTFWESEGRKDLALAHYKAALERVPAYAHAAAHLARLSPPAQAIEVLVPLCAKSDDPELEGVLSDKLRESGDKAGADAHLARAAARYAELTARMPAAFADHAAQFWLDTGNDPKKALELARVNLAVRQTPKAYELALLAAIAAGDRQSGCALGTEGLKLPRISSMFRGIAAGACDDH